jgi:ABC-type uncharacterized transport system ATPase component
LIVVGGSTGAGKSTVVNSLIGAVVSPAGEVAYCTKRIAELAEADAVVVHSETSQRQGSAESYTEAKRPTDAELNIWIRARHPSRTRIRERLP